MNVDQTIAINKDTGSSTRMLKAMVGIGLMCALLIVLTYETTLPRIERNKAEALKKAIFRVVPGINEKQDFVLDGEGGFKVAEEGTGNDNLIYAGFDESGKLTGIAIEASGQGFADVLKILYGYDPEKQEIVGFYVLESKETPGLGDKIEKDENFLANFDHLDVKLTTDLKKLQNEVITVKKGKKTQEWQIDGITGATISSRAIGEILNTSAAEWIPKIYENLDQIKK